MNPQAFDHVNRAAKSGKAEDVLQTLVDQLVAGKEFHRAFDALTMKTRHELGLPLIMTSPNSEIPEALKDPYEQRLIEACRQVGQWLLQEGEIGQAFHYFNMLGELGPVREAIETFAPKEDDDRKVEEIVEIAVAHGVHPAKGLKLVLERFGICQAITSCEQILVQAGDPTARQECIKLLVRELHSELVERLKAEITAKEGSAPAAASITLLLKGRDWLFDNENYHIDTSHLNSVVRVARLLPKCEEIFLAIQLCEYGVKLSDRYKYPDPPPFEDVYADSLVYLKTVAGMEVPKGLEHFRAKADSIDMDQEGTFAAEIYVNLLVQAGKKAEAVEYAARKLNDRTGHNLSCPSINDLCLQTTRYDLMADLARKRNDLVSYAAGLLLKSQSGA